MDLNLLTMGSADYPPPPECRVYSDSGKVKFNKSGMKKSTKVCWGIFTGAAFIAFSIVHPNLYPSTEPIKLVAFCVGVVFLTTSFMKIDVEK